MLNYLKQFFKEYSYEESDSAFLISTYEKVMENPETAALWNSSVASYEKDINCDYSEIISTADKVAAILNINEYTLEMLIFVCLSHHLKLIYAEKGFSDDMFRGVALDIKYKLDECKLVRGIVGSFVAIWFVGFFKLTRFSLGRLQFEIVDFGHHYEKDGKTLSPNSKVINVHIPRSMTPLDKDSCDKAYELAKLHFKGAYDEPCAFVCGSWLLYPENLRILSPTSNTHRFISEYDIIDSGINKDRDNLWRLFDTDEKNPDKLPANTSMRRAYVSHLKNGGKVGWGFGVMLR